MGGISSLGDMNSRLTHSKARRIRALPGGQRPAAARFKWNDVSTSDDRQMGSRNFGGGDPINMIGTTPPDVIEIIRGTCGRVGIAG